MNTGLSRAGAHHDPLTDLGFLSLSICGPTGHNFAKNSRVYCLSCTRLYVQYLCRHSSFERLYVHTAMMYVYTYDVSQNRVRVLSGNGVFVTFNNRDQPEGKHRGEQRLPSPRARRRRRQPCASACFFFFGSPDEEENRYRGLTRRRKYI